MVFDMRTLICFAAASHLMFAILMTAYWSHRRNDSALAIWAIGNSLGAVGWLFIGVRGQVPDWASIAVGNALIELNVMMIWAGMRAFADRRISWPTVVAPGVVIAILFTAVPVVRDNLANRVIAVNLALVLALILVARDSIRDRRVEALRARHIVVLALLGAVLVNLVRAVVSGELSPDADFLVGNQAQEIGMFAYCLAPLAWNVGLLLMSRERLENELHRIAHTDVLTGLHNRAGFAAIAQRTLTDTSSTVVLLMDLDNFKYVNDTYGHICGDRLLSAVADRVSTTIHSGAVARFGGDEFCALLPATSLHDGWVLADEVRETVADLDLKIDGTTISTTLSIGVAQVDADNADLDEALSCADQALYRAKRQGPNRVAL